MIAKRNIGASVLLMAALSGCGEKQEALKITTEQSDSTVLATVNGEAITEDDLEYAVTRTFSSSEQILVDTQIRQKVLESLVASKAMSQVVASQLTEQELLLIKQKAKAYEEELLVKEYLSINAVPEPVTTQMVEEYYRQSPDRFGAVSVKYFEMVKANRKPTETERAVILAKAGQFSNQTDWRALTDALNQELAKTTSTQPLVLRYYTSQANQGLLDKKLESLLSQLTVGKHSGFVFIEGIPQILKVVREEQLSPKPLHEVSSSIRKQLAPLQLRKAVKIATEEVITKAEVTYN